MNAEKSVKDEVREQRRQIEKSSRKIEREKQKLELEQKKMKTEIKKMAQNGQHVIFTNIILCLVSSKNAR